MGCIGLIKAYKNYDETFNTKFTSYAYTYIWGEIKKYVREDKSFKISREISGINYKINQAINLFRKTMTLSVSQRNELESIMALLTPPQYTTVTSAINAFTDGKLKKVALKLFKEITEGGKK